jgi:hypothetical protein
MEGILCTSAMARGIGERTHDLQELEDRAGPAVGHHQRQGGRMRGADVRELNGEPVEISVMNCGKAFRLASALRQSCSVAQ